MYLIINLNNLLLMSIFFINLMVLVLFVVYINSSNYKFKKILNQILTKTPDIIFFKIDYRTKKIKFINNKINNKNEMSLGEFAITILNISTNSPEMIALYIGKLDFENYINQEKIIIRCLIQKEKTLIGLMKFN